MRLSKIPDELVSGDAVEWLESESEYPSDTHSIRYVFISASLQIIVNSSAEGSDHLLQITAAASAEFLPGDYNYQRSIIETATSDRFTTASGSLRVLPNYEEANAGLDVRSWAEKTLEAVEAVIADKATKDQASYSIAGRSLSRYSYQDLLDLRSYCKRQIKSERRRERIKLGGKSGNRVLLRFPSGRL